MTMKEKSRDSLALLSRQPLKMTEWIPSGDNGICPEVSVILKIIKVFGPPCQDRE